MWTGKDECPQHLSHTGTQKIHLTRCQVSPRKLCELPRHHPVAEFGLHIYIFSPNSMRPLSHLGRPYGSPTACLTLFFLPQIWTHLPASRARAGWSCVSLCSWMAVLVLIVISEYMNSCVCTHTVHAPMWQWGVCRLCVWIHRPCVLDGLRSALAKEPPPCFCLCTELYFLWN